MSQQWPGQQIGAAPSSAPAAPRPVLTVPDASGELRDSIAAQGAGNDQVRTGIAVRSEGRDIERENFNQIDVLRQRYDAKPEVKNYRAVLPQLMGALKLPGDGTGDSALVYTWSKVMDPEGAVREGDVDMASSGASWTAARVAKLSKEFNLDGGGSLPQSVRDSLKRDMNIKVAEFGRAYMTQRERFIADARAAGLDPDRVVGPHDSEPFREDYYRLMGDRVQRPGGAGGVPQAGGNGGGGDSPLNNPTNQDIYANGVEFGMDKWGKDDPFDRASYLQENYGLSGGQEDEVVGFWNANRGNPNLSVDLVKGWYQGRGIPAPSDADIASSIDAAAKGASFGGVDTSAAEKRYTDQLDAVLSQRGVNPEGMTDTIAGKSTQGMLWGGLDEGYGIGGAVNAALQGENPIAGYQVERDVIRRQLERSAEANPWTAGIAELGGGLVTGGIGAGNAVRSVPAAARFGAKAGAVAGFNYGEGAGGSLAGAAMGAAMGAATGAGGQKLSQRLSARAAARAAAPLTEGGERIAAADRLNAQFGTKIQPTPSEVAGDGVRNATSGFSRMPFAASLIGRAQRRLSDEAEKARNAIASLAGAGSSNVETIGEGALQGAQNFIKRSKVKVDALYSKARRLAGGQRVSIPTAITQLDQELATLADTPGGADGVSYLQNLVGNLDGDWPIDGIKRFRRQVRGKLVKDGLRGSEIEAAALRIVDAAELDIEQGLVSAGKAEAAEAWAEASQAASERFAVIDEALAPIIGSKGSAPRSGEDIVKALETAAQRQSARLGKFMAALPDDDAASLRASLIGRLGLASDGQQNAARDVFSLDRFLTQWSGITDRAKSALFGGELRAALDDLAKVAEGRKYAGKTINPSGPGIGIVGSAFAAAGGASLTPWLFVVNAVDAAGGALLSSPKFARWLAKMPANPAAQRSHIASLSKIAAAEPAIAADIAGLQRQLSQAFSAETLPLAAETGAPAPDQSQNAGSGRTAQVPR